MRFSIILPEGTTHSGGTYIGFSKAAAGAVPTELTTFIGIGFRSMVPRVYAGSASGYPATDGGTPWPAGTYWATIEVEPELISFSITNGDGTLEWNRTVSRLTYGQITNVMVYNDDSRGLGGAGVGPLSLRSDASTALGSERNGIEGAAPSVNRSVDYAPSATQYLRIALPANYDSRKPSPLVIFAHGSGGNEMTPTEAGRMLSVTVAMQNAGYIVASSNQHGNNWGNPDSVTDLLSLYRKVRDRYAIGPVILMGQSMGGLSSLLTLARREIPGIVGYVGIYPVTSLADMYSRTYAGAIRTAYGFTDTADYATKTAGHDPNLIPASAFRGVPMRFYASPADTVVPKPANTDTFVAKFANMPAETVVVPCEGEHGHASHFLPNDVVTFLDRCLMR